MEGKNQVPVDKGWAWMVAFGYFVSIFCMVGIAKSFGILLEEFTEYFTIPVAMAALIMGVSGGVYTLTAPICVAAGTHFSQRKVVMLGGLIGSLGLSLSCLLFSIEWVILTFGAMYGFGNACIFGNGIVMLGHYFQKRRSLANGLSLSGASIGQLAIPPLLQYLLDTYKLQGTLLIIGGIYLNVIACGALYRPREFYTRPHKHKQNKLIANGEPSTWETKSPIVKQSRASSNYNPDGSLVERRLLDQTVDTGRYRTSSTGSIVIGSVASLHTMDTTHGQPSSKMADQDSSKCSCGDCQKCMIGLIDFRILKSYVVLLFVALSFLIFFGHFNFILFMPASASSTGVTKYRKALLVSVSGVCDLIGRILVGIAGDLNVIARYKLMAGATLGCSVSIFAFTFAGSFWPMAVCVGFYGFFGGCYVAINAPVLIDFVGLKNMPKVLGVVLFIQGLGSAIGQPCLGAIRDSMGSYTAVNYITTVSMLAGAILLLVYPCVKRLEERTNKQHEAVEMDPQTA